MNSKPLMRQDKFGRIYHRLTTGLQIAKNCHAYMRFMTLTSAATKKRTIKKSFDVLRKRIERAQHNRDGFQGFKFNRYFCLRTAEGHNVLHIIYWGQFIPQKWLSKNWQDIHGAKIVDIRRCYSNRQKVNGLVGYLLRQYLSDQPIERMSYGWRWAWLGFCKSWEKVKKTYGQLRKTPIWQFWGQYQWRLITRVINGFYTKTRFVVPKYNFQGKYSNQSIIAWLSILWKPPPTTRMTHINRYF